MIISIVALLIIVIGGPILAIRNTKNYTDSLVNFIPTFCTSMGVLFSFGTIYWVLASEDIGNKIQSGQLGVIIEDLAGKFLFSLIGILGSIIWSIIIKYRLTKEEEKEIQKEYMKENSQEILWKMRNEIQSINIQAKEQSANQINISNQINEIIKSITQLASVENSHLDTINSSIKRQHETLTNINVLIEGAGSSLEILLDDLKNKLQENINSMGKKATEEAVELHVAFENLLKTRMSILEEKSAKDIGDVQNEINTTLTGLQKTTQTNAEGLTSAIANINSTLSTLQDKLTLQIDTQVENVGINLTSELQKTIDAVLNSKVDEIKQIFDRLEDLRRESQTTLDTTTNKFVSAVDSFKDAQTVNREVLEEVKKQIETTHALQENTENLYNAFSIRENEINAMNNHIQTIANMAKELQKLSDILKQLTIIKD